MMVTAKPPKSNVAEGKADICIKKDPHTKEWDTAPSEVIVTEAGGVMTDLYGQKRLYNKEDVYNHDGFIITNSLSVLNEFKENK